MSNLIKLGTSLLCGTFLFVALSSVANADFDQVFICHLQDKVDPTLTFNDGIIIHPARTACKAHCRHGDHPMPVPLDNESHPNRSCARIHVEFGFPECEVNTPGDGVCSVDDCVARCDAT